MFILWSHKTMDQLFVKLINSEHTLLSLLLLKSEEQTKALKYLIDE